MLGLMQTQPLLISGLLTFAECHHSDAEIISRRVEGDIHRYAYADLARRARRLANLLQNWGTEPGDRIGTLAWNGYRHMELYYAGGGSGRVTHTINPRLIPDQIAWIINHAEDQALFFDLTFLPIVQLIHDKCPTVKHWVVMIDADRMPADTGIPGLENYEELLAAQSGDYEWPELDENTACGMCYTSGTTGRPKGVLYSNRSSVLHAYGISLPDVINISSRDSILPVVPMFHVNAWGVPYAAALTGTRVVFPGPALDGKSVYELIESEGITCAAGVPTVWQMLLNHMDANKLKFSTLNRTVIGGAACPPAMIDAFEERYDVRVLHAWGMTETSPVGTLSTLKNKHLELDPEAQKKILLKQGRAVFGVDMKIVGGDGKELPHDGRTAGSLMVKGPWVIEDYFRSGDPSPLVDGWFPTGDIATIDEDGYMQITDRTKDVIKSGGEWISSIDLENIAVAHPEVAEAACIGVKHPKWDERPILVAVKKPGSDLTREELLAFYQDKVAKWQIPDDVIFVDEIPHGATGKLLKIKLRDLLKDYRLPTT
jgi:fatty-acyl-CoA synthase